MKGLKAVLKACPCLFVLVCLAGVVGQPLAAQVTIPADATINSAVFSIYLGSPWVPNNQPVYVHRITSGWSECSVTYADFANSYDSAVVGSFLADGIGWHSVDITPLVISWRDGTYPNYGIAITQDPNTPANLYYSSESAYPLQGPKLVIGYTVGETYQEVTLPVPTDVQNGVADTFISEQFPTRNECAAPALITGYINGLPKYSLIWFNLTFPPPLEGSGTGTPGYWKNHPEAWPSNSITIGGITYTKDDAIRLMKKPVSGDKTFTVFASLVAAKLNVAIGNPDSCIKDAIIAADNWLATYPVGSRVSAGGADSPWRVGESIHMMLDAYNNGLLCAPHRD